MAQECRFSLIGAKARIRAAISPLRDRYLKSLCGVPAEYRPFERLMRQLDLPVVVSQAAAGLVATIACQQSVINL